MRILTGNDVALSFQEYVLNFGNEVLTFWVKGLTHFDVNSFTFNEQEMGMATISLDMFVQADMIPEFTSDWYVDFRGERFHLSTLEPAILKDNTSRFYRYSLIFRSERDDLQRYQFADFVSVEETPQPVSYDFVLPLTIQEFIERVNINLGYYLDGWAIELSPDYMDNLNSDIYDGTERITVSFSRQSLWSVIQSIYETYGLRWTISGKTISVGYAQSAINHVFEYGKDNGLTSIERVNTNLDIFTRLSGRGSTRNLPSTYFKTDEDPDANTLTSLIPINNLMPSNYRLYVQGWNDSSEALPPQSTDAAYLSGWNANNDGARFIPQDFVVDYDAEAKYGLRHTSIDDNDDIYPTLRTPIVGVELIEADKDVATITQEPVGKSLLLNKPLSISQFSPDIDDTIYTGVFPITETKSSIKSKLVISYPTTLTFTGSVQCDISLIRDGVQVDTRRYEEFTDWGFPVKAEHEVEFYDIVSGNHSIRMRTRIQYTSATSKEGVIPTITTELSQPIATASVVKTYKESFNIWIGDVWGSIKEVGDTDEEYTEKVWTPLKSTLGEMTVMFADGLLAGSDYEFKIKEGGIHYDTSKVGSHWRLDLMKSDAEYETSGFMLPNADRNAEIGDNIFFININMPFFPYVYDAEERLQDYLDKQLSYISTENPTYTIKPSSIFLEGFEENEAIKVGTVVPIKNQHIIGSGILYLTVSNLTITYTSDKQLPTWDIVVSETPDLAKNSIQTLQGEVKVLSTSLRSAQEMAEDITLQMDSRYLRRDGDTQKSYSPTQFTRPVTMDELSSSDYLQGLFGGAGYSIQKNADGDYVLEVDRINARKSLSVIELIVNQITAHGGMHIYSAASLTVSRVADGKVYFDTKNGTVHNQFVVGDFARGQRFNPSSSYWVEVTEVGVDYIVLDGATPLVGDVIAQLGNTSNVSRQSALIIDQTNGGTVTQYAYINSPSLENKDFVKYGVNPSTGKAFNIVYGDAYIGGRNPATDNYVAFDSGSGEIAFRGRIKQDSLAEDNGGNTSPITVDRGEYSPTQQYYVGNILTYLGSTYYCHTTPPSNDEPPITEAYFRLYASAGENAKLITLTATTQSISETELGVRTPSSIVLSAVQQNTVITTWEYKIDNGSWTTTKPAWISETSSTTRSIASSAFGATNLSVRASDGEVSDTVTIALLKDGGSAYTVLLSNEAHTLPCDTLGNVLSQAQTTVKVFRGATELTLGTDWSFSTITRSTGVSITRVGAVISTTAFAAAQASGYVDIDVSVGGLIITKRWTLAKSYEGVKGESNLNLITSTQSISVTPSGNAFTQSIQVRLQYGTSFISVAEWSELEISYSGLTYSAITTPSASVLSINLNGFTDEKTTVGFVTVNVTHFGVPMTLVISIARVFNPIQVSKGAYVSGQTYTGNCIQRDVVSYLGSYYAVKPTVGTTSTTWEGSEWEGLNSYKNVATDTLFADQANIAGFVYLNETMSSQTGTINGDTSTNWSHPDFVPNLVLDGVTGLLTARGATIYGNIYAESGEIGGFVIDSNGLKHGSPENWDSSTYELDYAIFSRDSIKIQDTDTYAGSAYNRTKVGFGKGSDPEDSTNKIAGYIYRNYIESTESNMYAPALKVVSDNGHNRDVAIKANGAVVVDGGVVNVGRFMDISGVGATTIIDLSFGNTICAMTTVFKVLYLPTKQNIINIIGENKTFCVEFNILIDRRSTEAVQLAFQSGETTLGFLGYNGTTVFQNVNLSKGDSMRLMLIWDGSEYFAQILSHQY